MTEYDSVWFIDSSISVTASQKDCSLYIDILIWGYTIENIYSVSYMMVIRANLSDTQPINSISLSTITKSELILNT